MEDKKMFKIAKGMYMSWLKEFQEMTRQQYAEYAKADNILRYGERYLNYNYLLGYVNCCEWLNELLIEHKDELPFWHDIKEEPPKYNTNLLFSFADGSVIEGKYRKYGIVQYKGFHIKTNAVAWQPLPEPYKGE